MTKTEQLTLTLFSIIANNPDYDTNAVAQYQFSTVCQELFASAKSQNASIVGHGHEGDNRNNKSMYNTGSQATNKIRQQYLSGGKKLYPDKKQAF